MTGRIMATETLTPRGTWDMAPAGLRQEAIIACVSEYLDGQRVCGGDGE